MDRIRAEIRVRGIVQGVGFRPFVHRLAGRLGLNGRVRNTSAGALIEAEGTREQIERFLASLKSEKPYLARIESVETVFSEARDDLRGFEIAESRTFSRRDTLIPPDTAVCPDCLREMNDPSDRRYRYPFINCTNCGPRFTIIGDVPYDRKFTTMSDFDLCPDCEAEYTDIGNRRYHAEPVCCPECGPRLIYYGADGTELPGDPVRNAAELLKKHGILAVKGLGGIHLACLIDDAETPAKLRRRKRRDEKPFAVMCRDAETARRYCEVSAEEQALLESPARPIVLLKKKDRRSLLPVSENGRLGVMLGYTPVHELLFGEGLDCFVMTSANLADLPILYRNEEALRELSGIADGFLLNDRGIRNRCDDSLYYVALGKPYPVRRSRGFVPSPLSLEGCGTGILACGAEQKASFSLSRGDSVFQSQHVGDLKNVETLEHYAGQIRFFEKLFSIEPRRLVCDLHPDYLSTDYAERRAEDEGLPLLRVQHHWAHMASCMADNELSGDVIGIVWDGSGLGTDGSVWGGEFLTGGYGGFRRAGSVKPFYLPGGDRAVREIRRIAEELLSESGARTSRAYPDAVPAHRPTDPVCTSMGRLFDGMCAILGIRETASYEGQGAVLLEAEADGSCGDVFPYEIGRQDGVFRFDWAAMIRAAAEEIRAAGQIPAAGNGPVRAAGRLAAMFMNTLVRAAADICGRIREETGLDRAVLSGGCFQNMYLLERLDRVLREYGFEVFRHGRVSCNDEGISFGQLAIAAFGEKSDVSGGAS